MAQISPFSSFFTSNFFRWDDCLRVKEGASLALKGVDGVHGCGGLMLGVLAVGDVVADHFSFFSSTTYFSERDAWALVAWLSWVLPSLSTKLTLPHQCCKKKIPFTRV